MEVMALKKKRTSYFSLIILVAILLVVLLAFIYAKFLVPSPLFAPPTQTEPPVETTPAYCLNKFLCFGGGGTTPPPSCSCPSGGCDDGNACTFDECDVSANCACKHSPVPPNSQNCAGSGLCCPSGMKCCSAGTFSVTYTCCDSNSESCGSSSGYPLCNPNNCDSATEFRCTGTGASSGKSRCCPKNVNGGTNNGVCVHSGYGAPVCGQSNNCPSGTTLCESDGGGKECCSAGYVCGVASSVKECVPTQNTCTGEGKTYCAGSNKYSQISLCCSPPKRCFHEKDGFPRCG